MSTNKSGQEIVCVECGENWYLSDAFAQRLQDRFGEDYAPPKRCFNCRQKRKEKNGNRDRPRP